MVIIIDIRVFCCNFAQIFKNLMKRLVQVLLVLAVSLSSQAATVFNGGRSDFRDETIYFTITTRFYDGDSSNNTYCWDGAKDATYHDPEWRGDFKGLIDRLDYIKALGFTAVWITPVVQNASGFDYHGYHAMDFSRVDRRYESDDCKLQDLIDAAHAKGMKIILDIVINHTGNFGEEHLCKLFNRDFNKPQSDIDQCMVPFTKKDGGLLNDNYLNLPGAQQYSDRLTKMKNTDGVNHDTHNLWHHYGNFNWDEPNRWWAQIAGDCVDLNTENPETAQYLINCYGKFIEMGVDGFRIDTGGHISRLTFNKVFIPAFAELGERYKSKRLNGCPFYMFAEVCARFSDVTYRGQPSLSPYFYTWKSDEALLDQWNESLDYWPSVEVFESTDPATLDNQRLCLAEHNANLSEKAQPRSTNALLNGNTYHAPDYSQASGMGVIDFTAHWNFQNAGRLWGVLDKDNLYNDATYNVVYVESHDYGPDSFSRFNGGTSQWAENLSLMFTMRGIPCLYYGGEIEFRKGVVMDKGTDEALTNTGRAYYGGYLTGELSVTDFGEVASADGNVAATLSRPLVHHLQRLNRIRAAVPALRKGQYTKTDCRSTSGYAFKRRYTDGEIDSYALVALNSGATFSNVLNGTYRDCITGDVMTVTNGTLTTPAFSGKGNLRIYVLDGPGKIGEDGPYLYDSTPMMPEQLAYDGHEEDGDPDTQYITGGYTPDPDPDLEPYEPQVEEDDMSVFLETPLTTGRVTTWVWNSNSNFTGGSWPGQPMEVMGTTDDGTRKIFRWIYEGDLTSVPTGIIFVVDGTQTANLTFRNHGYYIDGVWDHEVTNYTSPAPSLSVDVPGGRYTDPVTVTVTASDGTATIVYTTDGSKPTANSNAATGQVTLTFNDNTVLTAGVLVDGRVRNIITHEYIFHGFEPRTATIYLKDPTVSPDNWSQVYFYAWDKSGSLLGSWPGRLMSAETDVRMVKGTPFYAYPFTIGEDGYTFNIIFSQGDGGHQTVDITGLNKDTYFEIASTTNKYAVRDITADYSTLAGDVDGDGKVDVSDLNAIINIILELKTVGEYPGNADLNGDGKVDVEDVNAVINIILTN